MQPRFGVLSALNRNEIHVTVRPLERMLSVVDKDKENMKTFISQHKISRDVPKRRRTALTLVTSYMNNLIIATCNNLKSKVVKILTLRGIFKSETHHHGRASTLRVEEIKDILAEGKVNP
jgi:hypothetical protein